MNRLSKEKSPYLLKHASNPVNWYPWDEEAFKEAKLKNLPIFLSIGYSSCHWCHVMARESFEDLETARILNEHFISIKVDREERPDVDEIYMKAVLKMVGHGGWPLSVFLTPDLKPFYGGTYFPPEDKYGMLSFQKVLLWMVDLWNNNRSKIEESAQRIADNLKETYKKIGEELSPFPIDAAYSNLLLKFDDIYGGFDRVPKFPHSSILFFLLRYYNRTKKSRAMEMVSKTLTKMVEGGIFDQLGGGFHRYSADRTWLLPHFEKMLYDNALMAIAYVEAWQLTKNPIFAGAATRTLDWALREMKNPGGGFFSTQDSEVGGEDGAYYIWKEDEILKTLDARDAEVFNLHYGVSGEGNFKKGKKENILNIVKETSKIAKLLNMSEEEVSASIERSRERLFEIRNSRLKPFTDDKVLVSWNGLMVSSLAKAYQAFRHEEYLRAAQSSLQFIRDHLYDGENLLHRWRDGEASIDGFLDDYAFLIMGLLDTYESDFDISKLEWALKLNQRMIELFYDAKEGGFFFIQEGKPYVINRLKEIYDGATLSGNGVATLNLARIGRITANDQFLSISKDTLLTFWDVLEFNPEQYAYMLCALDFLLAPPREIVISGEKYSADFQEMLKEIHLSFIPNKVLVYNPNDSDSLYKLIPILREKTKIEDKPTVYICENYTCKKPVQDLSSLKKMFT